MFGHAIKTNLSNCLTFSTLVLHVVLPPFLLYCFFFSRFCDLCNSKSSLIFLKVIFFCTETTKTYGQVWIPTRSLSISNDEPVQHLDG